MTNSVDIQKVSDVLLANNNILILCHKNPDGDTLGSACALMHGLKSKGKQCAIMCHDAIPLKYNFMKPELYSEKFIPDFIVAADVASLQLFGDKTLPYSEDVDLCIDHHASNSNYAKMVCCDETMPATAQLMFLILETMQVKITPIIANCLYTGIVTDTGCFKYSSTTPQTLIAGSKLLEYGAEHTIITTKFFMSKSRKTIELEKYALNNLEFLYNGRCALVTLAKDILDEIKPEPDDVDGVSALPRTIDGVDIGVTIRQISAVAFKISIRTSENADACDIAQGLGGGGHKRAAGCEVIGSLESAKKAILKEVEKSLCR